MMENQWECPALRMTCRGFYEPKDRFAMQRRKQRALEDENAELRRKLATTRRALGDAQVTIAMKDAEAVLRDVTIAMMQARAVEEDAA